MKRHFIDYTLSRERAYDRYPSFIIFLIRCISSIIIFPYGLYKMTHYIQYSNGTMSDQMSYGGSYSLWFSIFAQTVCPIAIFGGFLTRISAFILAIDMLLIIKSNFFGPFESMSFPLLLMGLCIIVMIAGSGKYSIDNRIYSSKYEKFYTRYEIWGLICVIITFVILCAILAKALCGLTLAILLAMAVLSFIIGYNLIRNRSND